ncbi:MAG: hypothetical protein MHMPM18_002359 [Marteilia pararefringens]
MGLLDAFWRPAASTNNNNKPENAAQLQLAEDHDRQQVEMMISKYISEVNTASRLSDLRFALININKFSNKYIEEVANIASHAVAAALCKHLEDSSHPDRQLIEICIYILHGLFEYWSKIEKDCDIQLDATSVAASLVTSKNLMKWIFNDIIQNKDTALRSCELYLLFSIMRIAKNECQECHEKSVEFYDFFKIVFAAINQKVPSSFDSMTYKIRICSILRQFLEGSLRICESAVRVGILKHVKILFNAAPDLTEDQIELNDCVLDLMEFVSQTSVANNLSFIEMRLVQNYIAYLKQILVRHLSKVQHKSITVNQSSHIVKFSLKMLRTIRIMVKNISVFESLAEKTQSMDKSTTLVILSFKDSAMKLIELLGSLLVGNYDALEDQFELVREIDLLIGHLIEFLSHYDKDYLFHKDIDEIFVKEFSNTAKHEFRFPLTIHNHLIYHNGRNASQHNLKIIENKCVKYFMQDINLILEDKKSTQYYTFFLLDIIIDYSTGNVNPLSNNCHKSDGFVLNVWNNCLHVLHDSTRSLADVKGKHNMKHVLTILIIILINNSQEILKSNFFDSSNRESTLTTIIHNANLIINDDNYCDLSSSLATLLVCELQRIHCQVESKSFYEGIDYFRTQIVKPKGNKIEDELEKIIFLMKCNNKDDVIPGSLGIYSQGSYFTDLHNSYVLKYLKPTLYRIMNLLLDPKADSRQLEANRSHKVQKDLDDNRIRELESNLKELEVKNCDISNQSRDVVDKFNSLLLSYDKLYRMSLELQAENSKMNLSSQTVQNLTHANNPPEMFDYYNHNQF